MNLSGGLDVHQQDGSPTIGAGSLADASTSATDWEGDPRVIGDLPDMGADEAALPPLLSGSAVGTITATGATVIGRRHAERLGDDLPRRVRHDRRLRVGDRVDGGGLRRARGPGRVPLTGLASSTTHHARTRRAEREGDRRTAPT